MKIKKQFTDYFTNELITFVFDNIINDLFDNIENKIRRNSKHHLKNIIDNILLSSKNFYSMFTIQFNKRFLHEFNININLYKENFFWKNLIFSTIINKSIDNTKKQLNKIKTNLMKRVFKIDKYQ